MKQSVKQDQEQIKQHNKRMILGIIKKRLISRIEIANETGMSATAVSRLVNELIEQGLIYETSKFSGGVGRKAVMLALKEDWAYTAGILLKKRSIHIGLVNFKGELIDSISITHFAQKSTPSATLNLVVESINQLLATLQIPKHKLVGLAMGIPGIVDFAAGIVRYSTLLDWRNVNVKEKIQESFPVPIYVDNDLKVKIQAEYQYNSMNNRLALIEVGNGVGSAFISEGEVFRDGANLAGELGHLTVMPFGNLCSCGKRGCLETYVTEYALLKESRTIEPINDIHALYKAARKQESWAQSLLERTAFFIAVSLNTIVCLYNPDRLILCGELIQHYPEIVDLVNQYSQEEVWQPVDTSAEAVATGLRDEDIILSTGNIALKSYFLH